MDVSSEAKKKKTRFRVAQSAYIQHDNGFYSRNMLQDG